MNLQQVHTGNQVSQGAEGRSGPSYHIANTLKNLSIGQTIQGNVIAVREGEIDIALDKNTVMTAKLGQNMSVELGQILSFEVKAMSSSQISLSPLYENMASSPTILKAISAANIPMNETAVGMVSEMMNQGMSVDRNSLQGMYRSIVDFPKESGKMLIEMNRLQIPITKENIEQFTQYKNYEHGILQGMEQIGEDYGSTLKDMMQNGSLEDVKSFLKSTLPVFMEISEGEVLPDEVQKTLDSEAQSPKAQKTLDSEAQAPEAQKTLGSEAQAPRQGEKIVIAEGELPAESSKGIPAEDSIGGKEAVTQEIQLPVYGKALQQLAEQAGLPQEILTGMKEQALSAEEFLKAVYDLSEHTGNLPEQKDPLFSLLQNKDFLKTVKSQIEKQWLIQPEEVAKEGKVDELYKRIQQQTAKLLDNISTALKGDTVFSKSVENLSQSVDFMNQMNQVYTYIQLPLKMSNQNANGELYVYTNKKNLAKKDGSVSAFLHLDMEYLGTVDVYVAMKENRVNTKFYLENEESLDFLEANIHLLNERLEERGYQMNTTLQQREKQVRGVLDILEQEKGSTLLSQYAFDMRA